MDEANHSSTVDQHLSDEDTYEPTPEELRNTVGRIDALNYVGPDHPLLPPRRARSADGLVALRSRIRHHAAFWWDVFLAMQEKMNPQHYRALQVELTRLRQENERLEQTICKIRQQGYKDRATIDHLSRATPLNRVTQTSRATYLATEQEPLEAQSAGSYPQRILNDAIEERKRKRNRISGDKWQ